MDGFKPLLKIGGRTILERSIELFQRTGIGDIVAVLGHRSDELIPVVEKTMARFVVNQHYHDGMFSSIQRGVREIGQQCDAFFLLPVDTPLVRTSTIMQLLETFESMPTTLICTPQYNDRNGHPPLIDTCLIDEILAYDGQGGLRSLLRNYQDKSCSVAVPDKHILMDLDTRNDLAHLRDAAW